MFQCELLVQHLMLHLRVPNVEHLMTQEVLYKVFQPLFKLLNSKSLGCALFVFQVCLCTLQCTIHYFEIGS